jgi:biotin transport system substrate-specific component
MHTANTSQAANHPRAALPVQLDAFSRTLAGKAALVVAASLFVAVCAHLVVPLPFTPVPLTLGDLAVLLVGLALGPQMAFAALALYLAEGAAGLPVFAPTGPGGIAQLLGFTGGYLIAYPFAAALASFTVRALRKLPRYAAAFLACLAATALIMASGATWLGFYTHHAAPLTLKLAVLPFLPGQAVKVIAAAGIYASLARWRRA